jgi:hypothetical protein
VIGIRLELAGGALAGGGGYIIAAVPVTTAEYPCAARVAVGVYRRTADRPEVWTAWLWPAIADHSLHFAPSCESVERPDVSLLLDALQERAPWWAPPARLTAGSEFPAAASEVNWELLKDFYVRPHPLIRDIDTTGLNYGVIELLLEAKAVHHLLDLVGVRHGYGLDTRNIDDRTLIAVRGIMTLRERLSRISGWHSREVGPAGTAGDRCADCGLRWPCDTRRMADGTYDGDDDG